MHKALSLLALLLLVPCVGCEEPVRTLPVLKERPHPAPNPVNSRPMFGGYSRNGMTTGGMTYSGMTYSGMTYSGMTYGGLTYSGMTYSGLTGSGMTGGSGIILPSNGVTLPSSGMTTAQGEIEGMKPTGIVLPWAKKQEAKSDTTTVDVEVKLTNFEGLEDAIKQGGKVTVVDVWSTSCLPCMAEFHNLVQLNKRYSEQINCISLNVDYIGLKKKGPDAYLPNVLDFLTEKEATFTNFLSSEADEDIRQKLGIDSIPAILIYDASGKLAHKVTVDNSGDELTYVGDVVPKVKKLLGE